MRQAKSDNIGRIMGDHLRKTIGGGLLVLVSVVLAYMVLKLLFNVIDGVLQAGIEAVLGTTVAGLGAAALLLVVYVVGLLSVNFLGRRRISAAQSTLLRVPIVGSGYFSVRQLIESFSANKKDKKVWR